MGVVNRPRALARMLCYGLGKRQRPPEGDIDTEFVDRLSESADGAVIDVHLKVGHSWRSARTTR